MCSPVLNERLVELRPFCRGEPQAIEEGGVTYVVLPGLRFTSGGETVEINALLVPQQVASLGGYTTRLLLETRPPKALPNWSVVHALGSPWHTWSWNGIPSHWPWREILATHLKALA